MQPNKNNEIPAALLRVTLAVSYLWEVADRLGSFGAHGQPHIGWGYRIANRLLGIYGKRSKLFTYYAAQF